ncbi:hypothetical protein CLAFUW4_06710 [Fulvia fulva]|uniref:Uncharacterized protein n=1 Tax=Passalora fulva TaxID=5499 RepID=A0A9Q8LJ49_PASFU|nr:uncharacterized protein CLAFUR5_06852 [Fulvia fulva]KAK4622334.1 hypothetical protein CLAFUR4_06718 [Fulvia fulva]KAK4623076.1 hypothetical protein CLAFUR0_06712 [Fulvia fulva]UJO18440.1 hypothetical protein CLAFUR5_06852 [Fulvia fulva]WPV15899.1 hypothetical protein CLAFUW4_06710 [Fulvia fulva]WPV31350.1 hypothetical protein CLAFUW7_06709 [Fulvia fulva]
MQFSIIAMLAIIGFAVANPVDIVARDGDVLIKRQCPQNCAAQGLCCRVGPNNFNSCAGC